MTRLLYLPDDATVIQLEVEITPSQLTAAVNAGMRPLAVLKSAPPGKLSAIHAGTTVIIIPGGEPISCKNKSELSKRQAQVFELSARGLSTGEVREYAVLPADYLATGQIDVYGQQVQLLSGGSGSTAGVVVPYLVALNLTGDGAVAGALGNPTPGRLAQRHDLAPAAQAEGSNRALGEMVAQILPLMYYFLLLMGSTYLMRGVVAEKENRTVEMLLLSVEPRQMMVGKILAASVVTVIQVLVWVGGGMLMLNRGAEVSRIEAGSLRTASGELFEADEIFFANTPFKVIPVRRVEDREMPGAPGPMQRCLWDVLQRIAAGTEPAFADWLYPV